MSTYYGYAEPLPWEFATVAPPLPYQIPCNPSVDGWPLPNKSHSEKADVSTLREVYEEYRKEVLASNGFSVRQYNFRPSYIHHIITPFLEPESDKKVLDAFKFVLKEHKKRLEKCDPIREKLEQKYYKANKKQEANNGKDKQPALPLTKAKIVRACGQLIEQGSYLYITFEAEFEIGVAIAEDNLPCRYEALVFSRPGVRPDGVIGDVFTLCFIRHAKAHV